MEPREERPTTRDAALIRALVEIADTLVGTSVAVGDLRAAEVKERWPTFAPRALEAGFRSAYGFPLRLRDHARSNRRPIEEVCVEVVEGELAL